MNRSTQRCTMAFAFILTGLLSGCAAYEACGFRGCAGDAKVAANIQASIDQSPGLGPNLIVVQTLDHVVYLYGLVDTDLQRQQAESVALDTPGVARVVNSIATNNRG
jgi:osmotically-inducible protein OsmY